MILRWRTLDRAARLRRGGHTAELIALIDAVLAAMPSRAPWRHRTALLNERALAEVQVGRIGKARETLQQLRHALENDGRTLSILYATVTDNLGFVAREAGDLARACACHETAIALYEAIGAPRHLARALINAAIANKDRGLLSKARAQLERAMTAVPPTAHRLRGHLCATAALLAQRKHDLDEARRQHLLSVAAYRRAGDGENEALELHNLAVVEYSRGKAAVAARLLRKSMARNEHLGLPPGTARDLHFLGLVTFDGGRREEGLRLLRQAWHAFAEIEDVEGLLLCELDLSRIGAAAGAHERARALLDGAIRRAEAVGDPLLEYNLFVARGAVHEQLGEPEAAMRDYEAAVARTESLRASIRDEEDALQFFRYGHRAAFDALIELAVARLDTAAAWRCCQSAKARELQRHLRYDCGIAPRNAAPESLEQERALLVAYGKWMAVWRGGKRAEALPEIEAIERALGDLWEEIGRTDPEYVALRRAEVISYEEVGRVLREI